MDINQISNPSIVLKKAKEIYGDDVVIDFSTRKNKKYMILNPYTNKFIHFGSNMPDFTFHKDEQRRLNFLKRNHKWKLSEPYTPAFASFFLLW